MTAATAEANDTLKRNQYSRTGNGACRFVPLSHETHRRPNPEAFAPLNKIAEYAAGIESVSKKLFVENEMRDLSTTLCQAKHSLDATARSDGWQRQSFPDCLCPPLSGGLCCGRHDVAYMQLCGCVRGCVRRR